MDEKAIGIMRKLFLLLVLLPILLGAETYKQKLLRLKQELNSIRRKISLLQKKERNLSAEIEEIKKEEAALQELIDLYRTRMEEIDLDIAIYDRKIAALQDSIDASLERIGAGLDFLYRQGDEDFWEFFFVGGEASHGEKMAERIIEQEKAFYDLISARKDTLEMMKLKRQQDLQELQQIKNDIELRYVELRNLRERKKQLLAKMKREEIARRIELRQKEEEQRKLERLIADITNRRRRVVVSSGSRRRKPSAKLSLIWPVKGRIVQKFGILLNQQYETKTKSNGIDIKASPSASVKAAADGEVVYAAPFMGYGKMVIIDHGKFMTVYSGLAKIQVSLNQNVRQGDVIGKLPSKNPILHFELRINKKAVDPLLYLK